MVRKLLSAAVVMMVWTLSSAMPAAAEETVLFDFENPEDLAHWSTLIFTEEIKQPAAAVGDKDHPVKIELSTEGATRGKKALKLTFSGGRFPTVITQHFSVKDFSPYKTLRADVTVPRDCLVIFRLMRPDSQRDRTWEGTGTRYEKVARLEAGKNEVVEVLYPNAAYGATLQKKGGLASFEIMMFEPSPGESIIVDNVRLDTELPGATSRMSYLNIHYVGERSPYYPWWPKIGKKLKVLGTDWEVSSTLELAEKLKPTWKMPEHVEPEEVVAAFGAKYAELKKTHPRAVLAGFRDGERGYDPENPEKVYDGWRDCYMGGHDPGACMVNELGASRGKQPYIEMFLRRRAPVVKVDLSSIPTGSKILAARLLLVKHLVTGYDVEKREKTIKPGQSGFTFSAFKPTFFFAQPCNRPWVETEANGLQYAKGKYWREPCGMYHAGDDPDFFPLIIAYGQAGLNIQDWDFTEAVKYWTSGEHENHGFVMASSIPYSEWFQYHGRESRDVKKRPALLVIYEPRD